MAIYLPMMMQNLFNTPICLSARKAEMISAALSGRLNIQSIETETTKLDARGMRDLAESGRMDADIFRADFNAKKGQESGGAGVEALAGGGTPYQITESGIAIIHVHGTLTRTWGIGPYSGSTGYDGIWVQMLHAVENTKVKAIWIDINSGGGAVDGLFDLMDGIRSMSQKGGGPKPVWAFAGDYAYSAAYAIGAACDQFNMPLLGGVGSIGCITMYANIAGALDQAGINVKIIRSAARKAIGIGGVEELDAKELAHIQEQVDEVGTHFVERVASYRGIAKSKVSETEGWDYSGTQAKAIGLVDNILSEQDAWAKLERKIAR